MAIVVVQVGQCGNQLGEELWRQLSIATDKGAVRSPFFTSNRKARCVMVDSEPKVVQTVYNRYADIMRAENVVCGHSGRGNHWALGYYGLNNPKSSRCAEKAAASRPFQVTKDQRRGDNFVVRDALRAIYAETRRTDDTEEFEAILVLHSLAGGTGSGMASLLLEKIRYYFIEPTEDELANADEKAEADMMWNDGLDGMLMHKRRALFLISIAVAPQSIGEISTQSLNAALTLHALRIVDAVLLLRNDDCLRARDDRAAGPRGAGGKETISSSSSLSLLKPCATFTEVNEVFVTLLMPVLLYGVGESPICNLVLSCSPSHRKMNNILTIVPTPQRHYLRFKESSILSRFYCITGAKSHLPSVCPTVPVELLHTSRSLQSTDPVHSREEVKIPKPLYLSFVQPGSKKRSPAATLLTEIEGVLVMNQARELNAQLLFPLLRTAAVKVKAGAFMSTFLDSGVAAERIQLAIKSVALKLADAEED
ncbi:zeta tubulin [Trypanosoma brucei gambiense DAL972]|uniref:Zeta tubulin n=3 Tax=Trypanosoma brucei TaxID=5691 RepID=Q4GZA3_TRYB2|nr:zeta tubulin [Trypanosoma brucei brucei TREU927]XP_011771299.1 zeta tubulin [Trypanosoma brucei gambiense DAL972]RHW74492.1 zeta tubulin [Trypanosoma brucei equiperdum]CAJ16058.1 zeta tubulin [Trypanosoma brucei brucei TREU927]CBH08858.1 zeta tubulin [Trypanosoma brucei gambiense DAL972]|eukprot:XP_011771299.1 zeta tubulin [Trypanosoma brucei gambiense DAL972]